MPTLLIVLDTQRPSNILYTPQERVSLKLELQEHAGLVLVITNSHYLDYEHESYISQ